MSEIQGILQAVGALSATYLLALPIAWDRERRNRAAGLRTFPLVALASCGYMLLGQSMFVEEASRARMVQGLITGIGFIGGGAIVKHEARVEGTATAASLWITAGMGIAVAEGRFDVAILLSLTTFLTVRFLTQAKKQIGNDDSGHPEE